MTIIAPAALERALLRGMRPDAHLFVRPGWRRHVRSGFEDDLPFALSEQKYRSDQPRVPAGSREGGQWTDAGGGGGGGRVGGGINDHRIISDATPDPVRPGSQYAQRRRGGTTRVLVNGRQLEATPAQAARLTVVEAQARDAIRRVHALDPNWKPAPSFRDTVEGEIAAIHAEAREAQARLSDLARVGIGTGPYAGESIPARDPGKVFTAVERNAINSIGLETGCHTCGVTKPGTKYGNFVPDHQPPSALNFLGRQQRLYPQCLSCSRLQGGSITANKRPR
jgi:hypothetical protein